MMVFYQLHLHLRKLSLREMKSHLWLLQMTKSVSKAGTPSIHLSSIYWEKPTMSCAEDSETNVAKHLPGGIHIVPRNPKLE